MEDDPQPQEKPARRPYTPPRLIVYGDILTFTMGGSPGPGESASGGTRKSLQPGITPFPDFGGGSGVGMP
jgi:hypothetical protein